MQGLLAVGFVLVVAAQRVSEPTVLEELLAFRSSKVCQVVELAVGMSESSSAERFVLQAQLVPLYALIELFGRLV